MKNKILLLLLAAAVTVSAFAHGDGQGRRQKNDHGPRYTAPRYNQGPGRNQKTPPRQMAHNRREDLKRMNVEAVTVSGNLIVAQGSPAIKSGEVTYIIGGINRLTGFVDGLREGAQVTIEGSAMSRQNDDNVKFLRPATLTLGGRTYEMAVPRESQRNRESGERTPGNRQAPSGRNNPGGRQR